MTKGVLRCECGATSEAMSLDDGKAMSDTAFEKVGSILFNGSNFVIHGIEGR